MTLSEASKLIVYSLSKEISFKDCFNFEAYTAIGTLGLADGIQNSPSKVYGPFAFTYLKIGLSIWPIS